MFKNLITAVSIIAVVLICTFAVNISQAQEAYKPNIKVIKEKTIDYFNELRRLNNLPTVVYNAQAEKVAEKRAKAQGKETLSHDGLENDLKALKESNYGTENLLYNWFQNFKSDDEVAKALIVQWYIDEGVPNKGHHKQMLNGLYDITGVGIKQVSDGSFYVSMVLGSTSEVNKEKVEAINSFYEYFNTNDLRDSVPLN